MFALFVLIWQSVPEHLISRQHSRTFATQFPTSSRWLDEEVGLGQFEKVFLTQRFSFYFLQHAILEAETLVAHILDNVAVDLLVHLESISSSDQSFLLSYEDVEQCLKLRSLLFSDKSFFCNNALFGLQNHKLLLLVFVAPDLFLHSSIRIARAHLDDLTGEVYGEAEADGCLKLQALLAGNAGPLAARRPRRQSNDVTLKPNLLHICIE